jgi:hypothetical protein
MFRSNGIFLAGFIIWGLLGPPLLNRQTVSLYLLVPYLLQTYDLSASPQNPLEIPDIDNDRPQSVLRPPIPRLSLILFLLHNGASAPMVFPNPTIYLFICSIKILERRFPAILDYKSTSQFYFSCTNSFIDIRVLHSSFTKDVARTWLQQQLIAIPVFQITHH